MQGESVERRLVFPSLSLSISVSKRCLAAFRVRFSGWDHRDDGDIPGMVDGCGVHVGVVG